MHSNKEVRFGRYRLAGPHGPLHQGAQTIPLRPKALAVLWELVRRPGEVVTKDELLRTVWGDEQAATRNAVEVYVGYLRRKLEAVGAGEVVRTIRGHGYIASTPDLDSALGNK